MTTAREPGRIFTFYSYKGGTGRSMVLANVAWILASAGKRVLAIDWDLEAPGLHRYFRPFLIDDRLTSTPGLIDFVIRYATEAKKLSTRSAANGAREVRANNPSNGAPNWVREHANILDYRAAVDWDFPEGGCLDIVPAGKQDLTYAVRVSTFHWQNFYENLGGGHLINAMRDVIRDKYDYILIDSRTGVSDTAGICTVQLPDELVVCFTYNNQSTEGAAGVARSVYQQRYAEGGDTSFRVHPVPMRVDTYEEDRLRKRQQYARKLFDPVLPHVTGDRGAYWTAIEIPSIAAFAYEEVLATFSDDPSDPKRLLGALVRVTTQVTRGEVSSFRLLAEPTERADVLARFAAVDGEPTVRESVVEDPADATVRRAERAYAGLSSDDRTAAMWLWLRMVRVTGDEESSDLARVKVSVSELDPKRIPPAVIDTFVDAGVVNRVRSTLGREEKLEPIDDTLINRWSRIGDWVEKNREFLLWRQSMRSKLAEWEAKKKWRLLLDADNLTRGEKWQESGHDFSAREQQYIVAWQRFFMWIGALAIVVILSFLIAGSLWVNGFLRARNERLAREKVNLERAGVILVAAEAATDPVEAALLCAELKGLPEPENGLARARNIAKAVVPQLILRAGEVPTAIAFSPSGRSVIAATEEAVSLWDTTQGKVRDKRPSLNVYSLTMESDDVFSIGFRNGGATEIFVESSVDMEPVVQVGMGVNRLFVRSIAKDHIVTIDGEGVAKVLKAGAEPQTARLHPWNSPVTGVAVTRDGRSAVLADAQRVSVVGITPPKLRAIINVPRASDVSISADGKIVAVAKDKTIRLHDVDGKFLSGFARPTFIRSIALSPDGALLAWGEMDGVVRVLDRASSTYVNLRGHSGSITKVLFDANGNQLATTGADGTVRLWPGHPMAVVLPTRWSAVPNVFRARTGNCLQPQRRIDLLKETRDEANRAFGQCEAAQGRLDTSGGVDDVVQTNVN